MTFVELQEKWLQLRGDVEVELEKVYGLISSDEGQVRSTFDLLVSLDELSICEILEEMGEQLVIREELQHHRLLWEQCILEEVMSEDSVWHELYVGDVFRSLEVHVFGSTSWDELSESQQQKVVQESLRSVEVPAGTFMMGALRADGYAGEDERPRHEVTLTKGMSICVYACTQGLYESVMGINPSRCVGSMRPVEQVSWYDALLFCNKLSEKEGLEPCYVLPEPLSNDDALNHVKWNKSAKGYRLPTEAEWEYCARGGEEHLYAGSNDIEEVAWYGIFHLGNSGKETQPVGGKKTNGYGLYDMSGNISEWCWDSFCIDEKWRCTGASLYTSKAQIDPSVDELSQTRTYRGGGWYRKAWEARVSYRSHFKVAGRYYYLGFRFVRIAT